MFRPSTVTPMTPRNTTYSISNFSAILSPTCRPAKISPARCLPSWSRTCRRGEQRWKRQSRPCPEGPSPGGPPEANPHAIFTRMSSSPPMSSSPCFDLQPKYCHLQPYLKERIYQQLPKEESMKRKYKTSHECFLGTTVGLKGGLNRITRYQSRC